MRRGILGPALVAVALLATAAPSPADTIIEAETLRHDTAANGVRAEAGASDGGLLAFLVNGEATGTFTTSAPAVHLEVSGRGTTCDGAPEMRVFVDGEREMTAPLGASGLGWHGTDIHLGPGEHHLRVVFANDHRRGATLLQPGCDRNAFLDSIALYDRPYAEDSFTARPLADDAPIDPESDVFVAEVERLLAYEYPDIGRMPVTTTTSTWSVPVYTVTARQPTVRVDLDREQWAGGEGLSEKMAAVPLPPWAQPSRGGDKMLALWQPATGRIWEFWHLRKDLFGRWTSLWGGYAEDSHVFPGHFGAPGPQSTWGAAASKIGLLATLQRIEELRAGVIDHAVSVHLPALDVSKWRWPAHGADPWARMRGTIQEGMRFRLPADLDVDALGLSPYAAIVARAVQRHGMIVTDHSDRCICFPAEDPSRFATNPYTGRDGIFGGDSPDFSGFPWSELELVAVPAS